MIEDYALPRSFHATATNHYARVANWLHQEVARKSPGSYVFGIHGGQGTGKSTLSEYLKRHLTSLYGTNVATLSLDDFYLTRKERQGLAAAIHPLLETRGPPGTHDMDLAQEVLDSLKNLTETESIAMPRFHKATDDRAPREAWSIVHGPIDIVILEGWCVGCGPDTFGDLSKPFNEVERMKDPDGKWRRYVCGQLTNYQRLFNEIDTLLTLKAPSFECIYSWRRKQERKLRSSSTGESSRTMTDLELRDFVQLFERITAFSGPEISKTARIVIDLAPDHSITELAIR